jgi:hypothetical protein
LGGNVYLDVNINVFIHNYAISTYENYFTAKFIYFLLNYIAL